MKNFIPAPIPKFEETRIKELYNLHILDTGKEERFDRYTVLVADLFNVPIVLISLVDVNRQWFKSCVGLSIDGTERSISFCSYALHEEEILIISDATKNEIFSGNPLVLNEPKIRFYAGAILRGPTGQPVGTLCLIDKIPRKFKTIQQKRLIQFARLVEHELSYNYHLNEMRTKVENALYYDSQTGLPNRRLLKEHLERILAIVKHPQQIAIFSLKINHFQQISNAFGSAATTPIINETFKRLKKTLDKEDIISRWGDDYFIICIVIDVYSGSLLVKLEAILRLFEKPFGFKQENHLLTCKIGISLFPSDSEHAEHLVNNAIYAMQLPFDEGKSSYHFYSDENTQKLAKEYELEKLLRKAIETDSLEVVYQPKWDIFSGKICGAEALCRWETSNGVISPMKFTPLAERTDLIIHLGEWILRKVCKQNQEWQNQGSPKIPLSVNVSQKQLVKKNFHKDIQRILKETKLDPNYLDLEITESSLISTDEAIQNMNALCKLGVTFSLDDFGTGFSSLNYLQRLPIKTLKIDKSFIDNMVINKRDAVMVRTIIALAKALDLSCVAEGVELAEQLAFLRAYQCDHIQGYLISPPLKAKEFKEWLDKETLDLT